MNRQAAVYRDRQREAAESLNRIRERIANERAPLLQQVRVAEDRLLRAQSESRRTEINHETAAEQRRVLLKEIDELAKTTSYISTLAHDGLKAISDSLAPGEAQVAAEPITNLLDRMDRATTSDRAQAAVTGAELILGRVDRALGGYSVSGAALASADNQLHRGTFAYLGPEAFFRSDDGAVFGTLRARENSLYPTAYDVDGWSAADATALFASDSAPIPADASGGKALRLAETRGTLWAHIRKGGTVAFAILAAGLLAIVMVVQKTAEVLRMGVDAPDGISALLARISAGDTAGAKSELSQLRGCTAHLCASALDHRDAPKAVLEEILQSVLLEQRLRYERRLPLLAVIATAAPLMGLLGTVVGMVKTFALITVFGTGNAGKLSSGISEVLVATELGLLVAIPTLVAHGFLAHRVQKNLAALERRTLQLVTAIESANAEAAAEAAAK